MEETRSTEERGRSLTITRGREQVKAVENDHKEIFRRPEVFSDVRGSGLRIRSGADILFLPEGDCILGREEYGSEILGINPMVSRHHASVRTDLSGRLLIRDEGSLNGTSVDDGNGRRRLKASETAVLKSGDRFWLADQLFVVGG